MPQNIIENVSTLVIVGDWNKAIFNNEQWVAENIFKGGVSNIEHFLPMNIVRFTGKDYLLTVSERRLAMGLIKDDNSSIRNMHEALRTILQLLPHTPVNAFGINFIYEESNIDNVNNCQLFPPVITLPDEEPLNNIKESKVKWKLIEGVDEQEDLNIEAAKSEKGIRLSFNYNFPIESCQQILELLDDDELIFNRKERSEKIIETIFQS